ncbi:MAG: hypothetical protein JSS49_22840 [Planctomycetes bacterium]|nr:hypothetical protein [Planctomycetota bacterium]
MKNNNPYLRGLVMSPQFRSLLLKEWYERRHMFQFALVFTLGVLGYCVAYQIEYRTRTLIASYYSTCLSLSCLGAVLLAMSTATGEYSQRTIRFSASLPVPLSRVAWARLLGAWGCLAVPILCGGLIVTILLATGLAEQAGLRSEEIRLPDRPSLSRVDAIGFLWTIMVIAVTYAWHLSTLLCLLGTRCRNEGSVGLLGAVIVLLETVLVELPWSLSRQGQDFLADWMGGLLPGSLVVNWGYGDLDGSHYTDLDVAPMVVGPMLVSLLITTVMAFGFTRSYGSRLKSTSQSGPQRRWRPRLALPSVAARLGIHWPGRLAALSWLNARQSVPLGLAGLLIAVLITFIGMTDGHSGDAMTTQLASHLPSSTWFVGVLWAAVVAVGIFSAELKPRLEHFWQSRPLSPGTWFWMKYGIGLTAVVSTLDLIPSLFAGLSTSETIRHDETVSVAAYLTCMPLIHAQVYAVAVCAICRSRRMIPSAIIALFVFFVIDAVTTSIPGYHKLSTIDVFNELNQSFKSGEPVDLTRAGYPLVYGFVVAVIVMATLLARRSLTPPRRIQRVVLTAPLLAFALFCIGSEVRSAEPPTAGEVIAGIKQREAAVKNVRMRLSTKYHRTAAFFESNRASNRNRGTLPAKPVTEQSVYILSERPPCRAWSEVAADSSILSMSAFDGTTLRELKKASATGSFRMASTRANPTPFLSPESALSGTEMGPPLADLLASQDVISFSRRELDGEQLIDCVIDRRQGGLASEQAHFEVTFNASRDYWPIQLKYEVSLGSGGSVIMRHETTCEGWIDAGPVVYPRKLTQVTHRATPFPTEFEMTHPQSARQSKLEHVSTKESEILEIAVNTNLADAVFAPAFPDGTVFSDLADRKLYEVKAGAESLYIPKPKGIQGAVFVFHLLWITIAVVYLFWRSALA